MNVRSLAPLGLTLAIAASLAGCGTSESATPAANAAADAKPTFDLSQIKTPLISLNDVRSFADQDAADLAQRRRPGSCHFGVYRPERLRQPEVAEGQPGPGRPDHLGQLRDPA